MRLWRPAFVNTREGPHVIRRHTSSSPLTQSILSIIQSGARDTEVTVKGWVKTARPQKKNTFIEINDGSTIQNIQVVAESNDLNGLEINTGMCVSVTGKLIEAEGRKQSVEIYNPKITILGNSPIQEYPIHKQGLPLEYLREYPHLRPRTNTIAAAMRIRNQAIMAVHTFFQEREFINVHTPIITSNDCEGAGELFNVIPSTDFEGGKLVNKSTKDKFFSTDNAYLTVSGQLHGEIFACSMSKIYTFGPTFRAERSDTPRHLAEFWMIEPEVAFADLAQILTLAEDFVRYCVENIVRKCEKDIAFFQTWVNKDNKAALETILSPKPFLRLDYTDAIAILQKNNKEIKWGDDLSREHEKFLCEEYHYGPVFVINWPKSMKPFYMRVNEDGKTVANFDLLLPNVGELIGGSVREERYDVLVKQMMDHKMSIEPLQWYLDLRKFGTAPHAGFGLGFERLLLFVTGLKNVRDVIPVPRHYGGCKF